MNLAELARRLATVALAAVDPEQRVRAALEARQERFPAVLAIGKGALAMARGARPSLAPVARRLLVRPHTSPALLDPAWEQLSGGHPLPDRQSVAAGHRVERWLSELPPGRTLLALVSGGASACLESPALGISLEDLVATQRALLSSGLDIHTFNAVRKHLSTLKGGGALRRTGARVLQLLLSDVPGDDPATIASGPFAADPSTFADALAAISGLAIPPLVRAYLAAGAHGELPETVKPGDASLSRVETVLVGTAETAAQGAAAEARRQGFAATLGPLRGEAWRAARDLVAQGRALGPRAVLILAGETTVTLPAGTAGRGGRNTELALAAAKELTGTTGEAVLTLATDGEDGSSRTAGGVVDGRTWEAVQRSGVDPDLALSRHDSFRALSAIPGALLSTGPTGTNVGDLAIYLRE